MSLLEVKRGDFISPINKNEDDLFICATSFEDRCKAACEILAPQFRATHSLVFYYKDAFQKDKRERNLEIIDKKLKNHTTKLEGICCDFRNTYSLISELEKKVKDGNLNLNVKFITIDITCFTKLHLLLLLKYISQKTKAIIRFLYTEPLTYSTMEGKNLSYGFLEMETIRYKNAEIFSPKDKDCYIFFIGHEFARVYKAFVLLEPQRYWVIEGAPGFNNQLELFSKKKNAFLIEKAKKLNTLKSISTKNPIEVMKGIEEISYIEKEKSDTLVFVPCGTKLQALGIFLFSHVVSYYNLIISYPMPQRYEEKTYSRCYGKIWTFFWSNIIKEEGGYNLGLHSQVINRRELYE